MNTVFSHIVQKRLSQENENVATEALSFILNYSERARAGLMKLLRCLAPELPNLHFRTQQTEGSARPDMWGMDGIVARVLIENKFWAGLTENQPVEYLKILASNAVSSAILLAVVPDTRVETVWREFTRRLHDAGITHTPRDQVAGVQRVAVANYGPEFPTRPILAITSWTRILSAIDTELLDEAQTRNDVLQLRALCDAADEECEPFSAAGLTNQRTPAIVLHLAKVIRRAVDVCITEGILSVKGLNPQANWERQGRYLRFPSAHNVTAWFGIDYQLWRERGTTPLWLYFSAQAQSGSDRPAEVRAILEPWAEKEGVVYSLESDGSFALGIVVLAGEEQEHVVMLYAFKSDTLCTCLAPPLRPRCETGAAERGPSR